MKVTPVQGPGAIPPNGTPEATRSAKAIAAFNAGKSTYDKPQAQANPATNHSIDPNNISPEELSAVKPPTQEAAPAEEIDNGTPVEASPEETPDAPAPEAPKEDPALSRQFAQLARREKQLRIQAQKQQQEFKAREQALLARETAASQPTFDPKDYVPRSRLRQDALGVLAEEGVTYDSLTEQVINTQTVNPQLQAHINKLEAKLAELEKSTQETRQSYTQQQQAAYDAAVKQIRVDVKQLVQHDPNFETIKATNSVKDVVELITETYNRNGVLLSVEEAATEVENYLVEEATKLSRIGKIKKRLEQSAQTVKASPKTQASSKQPQMKTLTNATSSTRQLSAKERAILAFKGELKS